MPKTVLKLQMSAALSDTDTKPEALEHHLRDGKAVLCLAWVVVGK